MQFFCFFHRNLFLQISWMLIRNFLQSRKNKLSVIKNCKYCWKNKVIICIIDYKSFLYKTLLIVDTFLLMQVYCNKNSFYLLLAHSFRKHQIKMPIMNIFFLSIFFTRSFQPHYNVLFLFSFYRIWRNVICLSLWEHLWLFNHLLPLCLSKTKTFQYFITNKIILTMLYTMLLPVMHLLLFFI